MTEPDFTRKLCEHLRKNHHVEIFACVGQEMQSGWPDRHMVHWKFDGWFEFKSAGNQPTPRQQVRLGALWVRRPGHTWVVEMPGLIRLPYPPYSVVGTFDGCDADGALMFLETMQRLEPLYERAKT